MLARRVLAALVSAVLLIGCHHRPEQKGFAGLTDSPRTAVVQLWCDEIPHLEAIACHCWFASWSPGEGRWRRWEVWQDPGPRGSGTDWGHLRRDLMGVCSGVSDGDDGSPPWVLAEWRGAEAERLQAVLSRPESYPWRDVYRYWPGPNSNTYVAWVLREAELTDRLPPAALGAGYVIFDRPR